jgi:hypothetical protein
MVPFMKPFILVILAIVLSFEIAHVGQLMTLEAIVSCPKLVATTSTTKTWSFWVMSKLVCSEILDVRVYHYSCVKAYMMFRMASCVVIC